MFMISGGSIKRINYFVQVVVKCIFSLSQARRALPWILGSNSKGGLTYAKVSFKVELQPCFVFQKIRVFRSPSINCTNCIVPTRRLVSATFFWNVYENSLVSQWIDMSNADSEFENKRYESGDNIHRIFHSCLLNVWYNYCPSGPIV